jgi:hypothetical protein
MALVILSSLATHRAAAALPVEGSQGTNTALPPTTSAVTITGADVLGPTSPFANLKITVNQTRNLTNQAISVTWTGGTPTDSDLGKQGPFNDNYMQIFQCWGVDDHTNPLNPGPAPTGCEFGANMLNTPILSLSDANGGGPISRVVAGNDTSPYKFVDPQGGAAAIPFRPVDGTPPINFPVVASNSTVLGAPGVTWDNPYFDYTTTNEVDYARTYVDGTGSQLFTVDTGLEAPGLGCGEQITQPNQSTVTPLCWLVVVPRGTPAAEDPPGSTPQFVGTSALSGPAWDHRIAIPLNFNSIGSSCQLGSHERRIVGSELLQSAVTSWEPTLCATPGSPPYQYSPISDDQARQELLQGSTGGGPGMAVVSRPIDSTQVSPTDPVTYAPLSLSAVVIGINVDRTMDATVSDTAEQRLIGQLVQHIFLTPRLVAKLLTESYVAEFLQLNPFSAPSGYQWITKNPIALTSDPDFLQFNPEFRLLSCREQFDCGGLIVEQPTSDAAYELWSWILADPEAKAWLGGTPDQWGMRVNPFYSNSAKTNPSGTAFGTPIPEDFPKSDPYTYQNPTQLPGAGNQLPRPLGMQDVLPYGTSMQATALEVRSANDTAKTTLNGSALTPDTAWAANGPQPIGSQFELAVTDSPDAAQYGLQTASLSRAGDDGPNRTFVAPDTSGIEAGQKAMRDSSVSSVLQPNVSATSPGAYPLPSLTYAALTPASLDKPSCRDYATFIDYAVGKGQVQGVVPGELPPGYAPLPSGLVSQSTHAAQQIIAHCAQSTVAKPPPSTSTPSSGGKASSGGSASSGGTGATTFGATATASGAGSSTPTSPGSTSSPGSSSPTASSGATVPTANSGAIGSNGRPILNARVSAPRGRTSGTAMVLTRLLLPILLGIGLLAGLGARWIDVWTRRVRRTR